MPIDYELLHRAAQPGGPSALGVTTELAPAAGEHALVAPPKYALSRGGATYVFERRYVGGESVNTVLLDSRTSTANRIEEALDAAVRAGHPLLSRMPHVRVSYPTMNPPAEYPDWQLPGRAFDAHVRLGSVGGTPVTAAAEYVAARDATPENARGLLDLSPITVILGGWDSTRKHRQARFPAVVVGEIIGVLADQAEEQPSSLVTRRSGARIDPLAPAFDFTKDDLAAFNKHLAQDPQGAPKAASKASEFLIGANPPGVDNLDGIATKQIIRSRVLSFATLRRLRFGYGAEGDAAVRALLAAVALSLMTRADAELDLRANAHLREAAPPKVGIGLRFGEVDAPSYPTVDEADDLLNAAYEQAAKVAGITWSGQVFEVTGNPAIPAAADATKDAGEEG